MRAGLLKDRVSLIRIDLSKNPQTGAQVETRTKVVTRAAEIKERGGSRQNASDSEVDLYDVEITVRRDSLTSQAKAGWVVLDEYAQVEYKVEYVPAPECSIDRNKNPL